MKIELAHCNLIRVRVLVRKDGHAHVTIPREIIKKHNVKNGEMVEMAYLCRWGEDPETIQKKYLTTNQETPQ